MAPGLSPADRLLGSLFFALWRLAGCLAWPLLLLLPAARRHILRLPGPEPGWTWVHGASAGEHQAARALLGALDTPAWVTASSWRTPVAGSFPAPLDLPFVAEAWIRHHRPGRLILVEAELWPGWLVACRRLGVPVVVVQARDSRGTARWKALPPLWRWLSAGLRFLPQATLGDLKIAAPRPPPLWPRDRPTVVGASTQQGDEARLVGAWLKLAAPRPRLVLAPRQPARFDAVAAWLAGRGLAFSRRSAGAGAEAEILLLDGLGELAAALECADAAFVGGSFDPAVGGHSPAEAFAAGLPVVAGPHRGSNPAAWGAGRSFLVEDEASDFIFAEVLKGALAAGRRPCPVTDSAARVVAALPAPVAIAEVPQRPALAPLVLPVRWAGQQRRAWRGPPLRAPLPVISVGGLSAGGSGKTPAVGWLAARLPGAWVLGRGYRRDPAGPTLRVGMPGEAPAHDLGDELELLRRRGIPVLSCPDRVAGAVEAARLGARLVLLDDGFQHRRLARDFDLVCLDARWPGGGGPIPVGSAREPISALARADGLWLHHAESQIDLGASMARTAPSQPRVHARLHWTGLRGPDGLQPFSDLSGPQPVALGIARPEAVLCGLLRRGLHPSPLRLVGDHRALGSLPSGCILTEKDAARLPVGADVRVIETALVVEGGEALLAAIAARL